MRRAVMMVVGLIGAGLLVMIGLSIASRVQMPKMGLRSPAIEPHLRETLVPALRPGTRPQVRGTRPLLTFRVSRFTSHVTLAFSHPMSKSNTRLVYSSEHGTIRDVGADKPVNSGPRRGKKRSPAVPTVPDDGVVRVSRTSKGRKGKGVTLITGIPHKGDALKEIARDLKQRCGSGGTLRRDVIEIQGDHRDTLVVELEKRGYTVKKAGG